MCVFLHLKIVETLFSVDETLNLFLLMFQIKLKKFDLKQIKFV